MATTMCEAGAPQDATSPNSHNVLRLCAVQHVVRFAVSFLGMWRAFQKCNVSEIFSCWFKLRLSGCQTASSKHPCPSGDAASMGTNVPLINLKQTVAKRWKSATLKPVSCAQWLFHCVHLKGHKDTAWVDVGLRYDSSGFMSLLSRK